MANAPLPGRDGVRLKTDLACEPSEMFFGRALDEWKQLEMVQETGRQQFWAFMPLKF
jgi:hypothetical protein